MTIERIPLAAYRALLLMTQAELMAATPEERRRWRNALLREWEMNRARELDEDERRDSLRGHWGD